MIDAPSIEKLFSLKGKNIFIVGSTTGFGLIVAASFAKAGAMVTISGRRDAREEAEKIGSRYVQLDARDPVAFERTLIESKIAEKPKETYTPAIDLRKENGTGGGEK